MSAKLVSDIAATARSRLRTVRADVSVREVAQLLSSTQISLVVVCDQQGTMIGVVTKSDIVLQIGRCTGRTCTDSADAIMARNVILCRSTDGLRDVLSMMQSNGLVHIPVVDIQRQADRRRECARCAARAHARRSVRRGLAARLRDGGRLSLIRQSLFTWSQ